MQLIDALFDLCKDSAQPIIAIDGPAGAGKTTLAEHLTAALSLRYRVATLHMDDFYDGWDEPFDTTFQSAIKSACVAHQKSEPCSLSRYDWHAGKFGQAEPLPQSHLLILEGVASLDREFRPFLTASIWIEIDPKIGFERVISRDGEAISAPMNQWLNQQAQHFLENDSQNAADFVLTN
jgi:uridine kinase